MLLLKKFNHHRMMAKQTKIIRPAGIMITSPNISSLICKICHDAIYCCITRKGVTRKGGGESPILGTVYGKGDGWGDWLGCGVAIRSFLPQDASVPFGQNLRQLDQATRGN